MSHYKPYPAYKDSGVEWLGRLPEHWDVLSFQRCVSIAEGQVNPEQSPYSEMTLIAPNHIESGTGRVLYSETAAEQNAESGKYLCRSGDVVYSKIRPALRKVCFAKESSLCSADMYPMRGHSGMNNGFLFWFLLSEPFSAFAVLEADRVAMPKINRESLNAVQLPRPQLAEQQAITSRLYRETARIDALIEKKTHFIELLREKRQALITHVLTKGLNPDVKMKDSGVEWLGEVPEHWSVKPFKVCIDFQEGPGIMAADFCDEGVPLLRVAGVQDRWASLEGCNYLSPAKVEQQWSHFRLKEGDLLISASASMGTVCEVADEAIGAVAYTGLIRLRGKQGVMLRPYIRSLVVSSLFSTQIDFFKAGTTIQHFGPTHLSQMFVVCPPLKEQEFISQHLEDETLRIDELVAKSERSIELLKERRSALITAAVTGQIDLREAV